MNVNHMKHQVLPFPMERQVTIQGGRLASRKHTIHALIEVDVTNPRRIIHEHKARTGETLSFTAFIIVCLGKTIDQNKRIHAYRDWRNRLIIFDEVDVNTMVEAETDGEKGSYLIGFARRTSAHYEIFMMRFALPKQSQNRLGNLASNGSVSCLHSPGTFSSGSFSRIHNG